MSPNVPGLIAGFAVAAAVGTAGVPGTAAAAVPSPAPVASVGTWAADDGDIEDRDRAFWGYSSPADRENKDETPTPKRHYHYYYYDRYDLRVGPVFIGSDRGIDAIGRANPDFD